MCELRRRSYEFLIIAILVVASYSNSSMPAHAAENSQSGTFAELPGVKLWFTDSGGAGAPLVMLHSNTGTSVIWENQVKSFSHGGTASSPLTAGAGARVLRILRPDRSQVQLQAISMHSPIISSLSGSTCSESREAGLLLWIMPRGIRSDFEAL